MNMWSVRHPLLIFGKCLLCQYVKKKDAVFADSISFMEAEKSAGYFEEVPMIV